MTSPSQQKLRVVGPTVVTANRLRDGKVLYRAVNEGWTTRLEAAAVVTTTEAARELLTAAAREDADAIDPYAAPVAIRDGRIEPGNLRERIRAAGPSFALPATGELSHGN
jgi:predicted NAD/FAD-binding protein